MRYMVNPRKARRTAAQRAATRKMIAANKRRLRGGRKATSRRKRRYRRNAVTAAQRLARYRRSQSVGHGGRTKTRRRSSTVPKSRRKRKGSATMARRKRKRTTARRRSSARRRSTGARVQTLRRHSIYMTNPRRRRRGRGRYRRNSYSANPGIVATIKRGAFDAGATLVGGAVARMASGFLPSLGSPIVNVAAQFALGAGIGIASRKMVSADTSRFITAGAMQVPLKNLITTFIPQAGAFLGDYDNVGTYELPGGGVSGYMGDAQADLQGYEDEFSEVYGG